jgi:hypothetical protein
MASGNPGAVHFAAAVFMVDTSIRHALNKQGADDEH